MRALVLGTVSGLLYWAAHPPVGAGGLAFVALVPLLVGVRGCGPATGLAAGWLAGTIACNGLTSASILAALLRAGHPAWLAAVEAFVVPQLCGAIWFGAFGAYAAVRRRTPWAVLVLPSAWVAGELARSRLGDGMPWVLLGHALAGAPTWLQVADLAGAYGVSFVAALVNVAVASALGPERRGLGLGTATAVVLAAFVYGRAGLGRWEAPGGAPLGVAVVQAGVPEAWRASLSHQRDAVARLRSLVERAARERPSLVVLPENAIGVAPATNPGVFAEIARPLADDALLLIGAPRPVQSDGGRAAVRNSAHLVDARGAVRGVYDKRHLVPFGETTPWPLPRSAGLPDDYVPGDTASVLPAGPAALAPAICWEGIHADVVASAVRSGATLLASLSNDDWFAGRAAVEQHFQATLFRAVETRRWLVRATNTGVTAIVDPRGIATVAPRDEPTTLSGRVTLETGVTPYVRFGDAFAWLCCAVAAAGIGAAVRRR